MAEGFAESGVPFTPRKGKRWDHEERCPLTIETDVPIFLGRPTRLAGHLLRVEGLNPDNHETLNFYFLVACIFIKIIGLQAPRRKYLCGILPRAHCQLGLRLDGFQLAFTLQEFRSRVRMS